MIFINHKPVTTTITGLPGDGMQLAHAYAYAMGKLEARYPMPAIRYDADWCEYPDSFFRVVIFRIHTDDDYELPEIVKQF